MALASTKWNESETANKVSSVSSSMVNLRSLVAYSIARATFKLFAKVTW